MKFVSSAITVLAVASSATAFAPVQPGRGVSSVTLQSSVVDTLGLENIESEVSRVILLLLSLSCTTL